MLNIPGLVFGTLVLNNPTYPFFLPSKDFLYRTWLSQLFYLILLLSSWGSSSGAQISFLCFRGLTGPPLSCTLCSERSSCLELGANWATTENTNSNGVGDERTKAQPHRTPASRPRWRDTSQETLSPEGGQSQRPLCIREVTPGLDPVAGSSPSSQRFLPGSSRAQSRVLLYTRVLCGVRPHGAGS